MLRNNVLRRGIKCYKEGRFGKVFGFVNIFCLRVRWGYLWFVLSFKGEFLKGF